MNSNQILQIVIGFVLTIAVSGLGFIWGEIDSLKQEVITQRVQLAQLITPDGVVISSPENAEARQDVADRLNELELEVKLAGQEERGLLQNDITILTQRIFALEEFRNAPSRSAAEVEKLQMQIDYMYREIMCKIGHIEDME